MTSGPTWTIAEIADVLELSPTTVHRELQFAKAWLWSQFSGRDRRRWEDQLK